MNSKQARELATRMLAEADSTGSATYDTILVTHNDDGLYSEADNGDGADGLSRESAYNVLVADLEQK